MKKFFFLTLIVLLIFACNNRSSISEEKLVKKSLADSIRADFDTSNLFLNTFHADSHRTQDGVVGPMTK